MKTGGADGMQEIYEIIGSSKIKTARFGRGNLLIAAEEEGEQTPEAAFHLPLVGIIYGTALVLKETDEGVLALDVDTGLHGHHVAGHQHLVGGDRGGKTGGLMDVQTHAVTQAVAEQTLVAGAVDDVTGDLVGLGAGKPHAQGLNAPATILTARQQNFSSKRQKTTLV